VIESPPGEEVKEAERTKRHLSIAKVDAPSQSSEQQTNNEETRQGLKRLAEFISKQRRAADHLKPEAPSPELVEKRVLDSSHEFTKLMMDWDARPRAINSMAQVIADEMLRRRGLKAYQKMRDALKKQPSSEAPPSGEEESGLPEVVDF